MGQQYRWKKSDILGSITQTRERNPYFNPLSINNLQVVTNPTTQSWQNKPLTAIAAHTDTHIPYTNLIPENIINVASVPVGSGKLTNLRKGKGVPTHICIWKNPYRLFSFGLHFLSLSLPDRQTNTLRLSQTADWDPLYPLDNLARSDNFGQLYLLSS